MGDRIRPGAAALRHSPATALARADERERATAAIHVAETRSVLHAARIIMERPSMARGIAPP